MCGLQKQNPIQNTGILSSYTDSCHLQSIYLEDGWHILIMPPYETTEVWLAFMLRSLYFVYSTEACESIWACWSIVRIGRVK